MAEQPKDGGPAFPRAPFDVNDYCGDGSPGMSLRDWFAGQAPEAPDWWMTDGCPIPPPGWKEGEGAVAWGIAVDRWNMMRITSWKFAYADAMLEARRK